jgi:hypothetical protein
MLRDLEGYTTVREYEVYQDELHGAGTRKPGKNTHYGATEAAQKPAL